MRGDRTATGLHQIDPTTPVSPLPTLELACGECGYGIIVRRPPPTCPMCGKQAWESPVWRPFTRLAKPPGSAA